MEQYADEIASYGAPPNAHVVSSYSALDGVPFSSNMIYGGKLAADHYNEMAKQLAEHTNPKQEAPHHSAALGIVHGILDFAGMIPVVGTAAEAINGGIYLAQGDYVNASFSAAAMIPGVGDAAIAGKYAYKGVKYTEEAVKVVGDIEKTSSKISKGAEDLSKSIDDGESAVNIIHKSTGNGYKYWNKTTEFKNVKVYQRDDIIDPNMKDAMGRTNLERMKKGLAPLGSDGKSINLHHTTQRNTSSIAEVTQSFHKENSSVIHINPNTIPSGINRTAFNKWRTDYWKNRANDF